MLSQSSPEAYMQEWRSQEFIIAIVSLIGATMVDTGEKFAF